MYKPYSPEWTRYRYLKEAIDAYLNDGIDNPTLIKDLLTIVGERQLTAQEEYKKMSDLVKNLRK